MQTIDYYTTRRSFSRAAHRYNQTAILQRTVETQLLERLDYLVEVTPACVLDIGSGTRRATQHLKQLWPNTHVIALDSAIGMLKYGNDTLHIDKINADAHVLPIANQSVDVLFSNLCIQWCADLTEVFKEFHRVLKHNGLLLLSTFGPNTLHELRQSWAMVDTQPRVHHFPSIAILGDLLTYAAFDKPVLDIDQYQLTYRDVKTLLHELKAIGATNAHSKRQRGLQGKQQLKKMYAEYELFRENDVLPASYEVIGIQAFANHKLKTTSQKNTQYFDIEQLKGSRIKR